MGEPKLDWRDSFHQQIRDWKEQLRDWRRDQVGPCFELRNGKRRFPRDMTDQDVDEVAWFEAEKDLIRAQNEWGHAENARKIRRSEAL